MSTGASTQTAAPHGDADRLTLRLLVARYKAFSLAVLALLVLLVAMLLAAIFGSRAAAVSDSTTCADWGSVSQTRQQAFAALYAKEHTVLAGVPRNAAGIEAAINNGCMQAYASDVDDSVTVVQAMRGEY